MKALSIKQPWAYLIVNGQKDIENRTWFSGYAGPLLIHASKSWDADGYEFLKSKSKMKYLLENSNWPPYKNSGSYDFGCLIGKVYMSDCVVMHPSKWFFGPYGFVFKNAKKFKEPIPYRGKLKFFDVQESLLKE